MPRFIALFFTTLLLLQTLGPELLVVNYALNRAQITARFCVNKAKPVLRCNGQCHLAQQLRKAEGLNKKTPTGPAAQIKYEVLPTAALTLRVPHRWPLPARRYPTHPAAHCAARPAPRVFRPPLSIT